MLAPGDSAHPDKVAPRTARDWSFDAGVFAIAVALGAVSLSLTGDLTDNPMTSTPTDAGPSPRRLLHDPQRGGYVEAAESSGHQQRTEGDRDHTEQRRADQA